MLMTQRSKCQTPPPGGSTRTSHSAPLRRASQGDGVTYKGVPYSANTYVNREPYTALYESEQYTIESCSNSSHGSYSRRESSSHDGDQAYHYGADARLQDDIERFAAEKKRKTMGVTDEDAWRESIRRQMESELNQRVRDALETPSPKHNTSRGVTARSGDGEGDPNGLQKLNAHVDLSSRDRDALSQRRWKVLQAKRQLQQLMTRGAGGRYYDDGRAALYGDDDEKQARRSEYENLINSFSQDHNHSSTSASNKPHRTRSQDFYEKLHSKAFTDYGNMTNSEKFEYFYAFTKNAFKEAMRTGHLPDGTALEMLDNGRFRDAFGIVRDEHGPFWPSDYGPMFPAPDHSIQGKVAKAELMVDSDKPEKQHTTDTNPTNTRQYPGRWRGVNIIYDSEKSCRDYLPRTVSDGLCPSLCFESRFECGNLRQARRIGHFEYELVLRTDLYTSRHTQWYYFRVTNAVPGVTYKFKIINLHKRDSLYNHGMRPLLYSDKNAETHKRGWTRVGHHIAYGRNINNMQCPLLARDRNYHTLEWQLEFPNAEDSYYLAHCYPYTFSDLRDDLDVLLNDPERSGVMKRQVMCETRAGNSCFLVTVTNFKSADHSSKKAVVVTARVHPGETNSSWMMKGVLEYITGTSNTAKALRDKFIFKIIPMLNPDGVIVGNYRCSLAGRDLNRNYRHPRKDSFPTVWATKAVMEEVAQWNDIAIYCDLHGHSRKHNVFMYGCNYEYGQQVFGADPGATQGSNGVTTQGSNGTGPPEINPEKYLQERLFPWLMSQKAPDKFWFRGCKFAVRRCKESTGRVVMYRQMRIRNSFTMEATFCGTTISRGERRHFNTADFQEMGRVFCDVVLDYDQVLQDKARQSEVVLELTRAITQQILESRGLLPDNLPDITTEKGREQLKTFSKEAIASSEQIAQAFIAMVTKDKSAGDGETKEPITEVLDEGGGANEPRDYSKMDVQQLLDTMSSQTIDGCAELLEQLHVAETVAESDSSDSDSESEPEMKYSDPKRYKNKKKKKKKGRGSASEGLGSAERGKVENQREAPTSQPTSQASNPSSASESKVEGNNGLPAIDGESQKNRKQGSGSGRYSKTAKSYPTYVNRYVHRSNGGIPCFSQERLMERASKRLQDMKKRIDDDHPWRESGDDDAPSLISAPDPPLRQSSQSELRRQYQQLMQPAVRTGYMHAESEPGGVAHPDDSTSDSCSDIEEVTHRLPLAAMRTPYQNALTPLSGHGLSRRSLGPRSPWLPVIPHVPLRCSIPARQAMTTNMVITQINNRHSDPHSLQGHSQQGQGHGLQGHTLQLGVDTTGGGMVHSASHRKDRKQKDSQTPDALPSAQGSLGLMSREYTDLLMTRLRNNKGISRKPGERHSTCE